MTLIINKVDTYAKGMQGCILWIEYTLTFEIQCTAIFFSLCISTLFVPFS